MEHKNRVVLGIMLIAVMLIGSVLAVAYFLTGVNNDKPEVLTVNTGSLSLIFEDGNDGMQVKSLMLGESVSKEVKITNNGTLPATTNLNWKDLTNTYLAKSLSYKVQYKTSEAGAWTDVIAEHTNVPTSARETEVTILRDITIPTETTYFYKITIKLENTDENQENDKNAMLATRFSLGKYYKALGPSEKAIEHLNIEVKEGTPTFANPATTDEGVFAMEDDYGTSYYYRGSVTNNYVKFGGFYWRIIRINGDGSLRMLYDGTNYHANGESSADRYAKTSQPYNAKYNDAKYVGYMFGGSSKDAPSTSASDAQTNTYDSSIKTVVDEWYEKSILKNATNGDKDLTKYLADAIFCNDRTMPAEGGKWWTSQDATHTNLGWATHKTPYGVWGRFMTSNSIANANPVPKLKCNDNLTTGNRNNDKFTVSDTELGNGALKYPIGLITADEVMTAGSGKYGTSNSKYYLYKHPSYYTWTSSSTIFNGSHASVWANYNNRDSNYKGVNYSGAVVPVINLKAEYVQKLVGTGVQNDEYRLADVN